MQRWLAIDATWTEQVRQAARYRPVRWLATVLAHSGDSLLWLIMGGGLWRFTYGFWSRVGERIVIVTAITWVLTTLLKLFFQRPRPEGEQKLFYLDIDANSFPSGHAVRTGGLVTALAPLLPGWGVIGFVMWALSVCASRVVLGVHYLSDVVAGLGFGALAGLLLLGW